MVFCQNIDYTEFCLATESLNKKPSFKNILLSVKPKRNNEMGKINTRIIAIKLYCYVLSISK